MRVAIMESVVTPGGHEIDYDRILVEELQALGHEVEFYVPEGHEFKWNYGVPVTRLPGEGVSYQGAKGAKKIWLTLKREWNRQRWYKSLYESAQQNKFDMIIFPSATYRYLRALHTSPLAESPVPVVFVIHGLTPTEAAKLAAQADKIKHRPQIQIGVQTFSQELFTEHHANISCFFPPAYIPRDIEQHIDTAVPAILQLGFFGQYRREKNLDPFLEAFVSGSYDRPVKLLVQGATTNKEDAADFERIINKFSSYAGLLEFWHKALIGAEWQRAIASVDAIVMPYSAPRYRYHTSAMLSTAIGFHKPVIAADSLNPEVLARYRIGLSFPVGDNRKLQETLEQFVNTIDQRYSLYQEELKRANEDFSPRKLAENIVRLAQGRRDEC